MTPILGMAAFRVLTPGTDGVFTETMWWMFILIIVGFLLMLPLWVWLALRHKHTAVVLRQGWTPVLSALFISG